MRRKEWVLCSFAAARVCFLSKSADIRSVNVVPELNRLRTLSPLAQPQNSRDKKWSSVTNTRRVCAIGLSGKLRRASRQSFSTVIAGRDYLTCPTFRFASLKAKDY